MKVGIIDIGIGNIASVFNALIKLDMDPFICSDPALLSDADSVVLPGVGAFPAAMKKIRETGFDDALHDHTASGGVLIGICLGMQLLFSESSEIFPEKGLDIIGGKVEPFPQTVQLPVPHTGWNNIYSRDPSLSEFEGDYYFVHSYHCVPKLARSILFECDYGVPFVAGVTSGDGVYGFQFHPEKSQKIGLDLLKKYLFLC
jgi:imidazole glycerol-phosphate synthase subunit HisH